MANDKKEKKPKPPEISPYVFPVLLAAFGLWCFYDGWLTTDVDENLRAVGFYRHLGWEDWKFEDGDRFMKKRLPGEVSSE